jgi:hypothetical protein
MKLMVLLEKIVATTEEGVTLTNLIKQKLAQYPEIEVSSQCVDVIVQPE